MELRVEPSLNLKELLRLIRTSVAMLSNQESPINREKYIRKTGEG